MLGGLLASTVLSLLLGSRPAAAFSCFPGEAVVMSNPVVTVIEGEGDPDAEQAQWAALEYAGVYGQLEMGLGQRTWSLEEAP